MMSFTPTGSFILLFALLPALLMLLVLLLATKTVPLTVLWRRFYALAWLALLASLAALSLELWAFYHPMLEQPTQPQPAFYLRTSLVGAWVSVLVQFLGTVIIRFSKTHLQGEPNQPRYIKALACVLVSVHLLLLANHWLVFITVWAAIGLAMHPLLVFYPERSFAQLAAHKKRVADRAADLLLCLAAACAWQTAGSGYLSDLWQLSALATSQEAHGWLSASAISLVLAVILRTALLPVHGWLIQVMEAPTPVSALLHAGVVNLGGFILILFAPLLTVSNSARWLLVVFGLVTAVLAGTVMLTRISIKVHLAWSTLAQMGFMLLECGLGLYSLAALHLLGHSLYKAHSFLSASSQVSRTRQALLCGHSHNQAWSLYLAPLLSGGIVFGCQALIGSSAWTWWWQAVLALAFAPLLWLPSNARWSNAVTGLAMVFGFTLAALNVEHLPLNLAMQPFVQGGWLALFGLSFMYLGFVGLQLWPAAHRGVRHWIYAGFYLDELYTRAALYLWPAQWVRTSKKPLPSQLALKETQHA